MILLFRLFSLYDIILVPICFLILFAIIRAKAERKKEADFKRLYYRAFYFKVFCVIGFTFITDFYFNGGDTMLYYQGILDLRKALNADLKYLYDIITSLSLSTTNPLTPFFLYDTFSLDCTYCYMTSSSNFFVPRLGLLPSVLFFNSYLCIALCFGFFALAGAIRLFRFFYHYYPNQWREIALATLFLPSVAFWSSGLLKDPICFGAVGFIMYGMLNLLVKKQKIISSLIIILICSLLLFYIKVYILLTIFLCITIWLFATFNKVIENITLRRIFAVMSFAIAITFGILMIRYLTSMEAAQTYKLEELMAKSNQQREVYAFRQAQTSGGSYFYINTSNPVYLVFNSIVATLYRPFVWEVRSPVILLAAIEAFLFLLLTLNFFFKKGIGAFFRISFSNPVLLMCFVFSIIFAVAVGSSTPNFGSLSRYKIPCTPFYLLMILLLHHIAGVRYPKWMYKILGYKKAPQKELPGYNPELNRNVAERSIN